MKKISILSLVATLACSPAFAQYYPPSSSDLPVPNSVGPTTSATQHTGTDIILDAKSGKSLQTMVWDNSTNGRVYLAWSVGSSFNPSDYLEITPPPGTQELSDPDVTTAYNRDGTLYAAVVYLAKNTTLGANATVRTYLDIYEWDGSNFVQNNAYSSGQPRPLGIAGISNVSGTANRIHSSPNVDANADGALGVVWQETSVETAEIRVISPSYPAPNGYTFNQDVRFAESYVLSGHIDGRSIACSGRGANAARVAFGPNPPILFNQTLLPDVAVSPNGTLSFCYISSAADPTSTPVTSGVSLVVKQYRPDCGNFGDGGFSSPTYSWSIPGTHGAPRIAATANTKPDQMADVEVVMAWSGGACLEKIGSRSYYQVFNWGRSGGSWRPNATAVSIPVVASQNGYPAANPVVAYVGSQEGKYSNEYTVAWEGTNYPGDNNAVDIWSTTLKAGSLTYGNSYSRVNYNFGGNQLYPSVAGRYSGTSGSTAYVFYDQSVTQISFRHSAVQAGDGNLQRPAAPAAPAGISSLDGTIRAYPNPSTDAINFGLTLQPGETVQQLTVVDVLGRVVDRVTVPTQQTSKQTLRWQPKTNVPQGNYIVKLVTNQRTENITVRRER